MVGSGGEGREGCRERLCGGRVAWQEELGLGWARLPKAGGVVAVQSAPWAPTGTQERGSLFRGSCGQGRCCSELQGHGKAFWLVRSSETGVAAEHARPSSPFCSARRAPPAGWSREQMGKQGSVCLSSLPPLAPGTISCLFHPLWEKKSPSSTAPNSPTRFHLCCRADPEEKEQGKKLSSFVSAVLLGRKLGFSHPIPCTE